MGSDSMGGRCPMEEWGQFGVVAMDLTGDLPLDVTPGTG